MLINTNTRTVFRIVGSQMLNNCLHFPPTIHRVYVTPMEKGTHFNE